MVRIVKRNMKKLLVIISIIITANLQCSGAESLQKISLTEALRLAQTSNLDLQAERLDKEIAQNDIKISNRLKNPDIDLFYNMGSAGKGNPQQIGATQMIELGKRGGRKQLAKSNFKLTEEKVKYTEFNVRMGIRKAYLELVSTKSILSELEDQKDLLEKLVKTAEELVKKGAVQEIDLLQAEIALNQIETQINTAKANLKREQYEFNKALNINTGEIIYDTEETELPPEGEFIKLLTPDPKSKLPEFEEISEKIIEKRYDVKVAKNQIELATKNLTVVANQRIPDIEITGGYGYQTKSFSEDGVYKSGAYAGASLVNIPLLYSYKPEIKTAKIQIEQAKIKYDSTKNKAQNDLKGAYGKFRISKENLNYYNNKLLNKSKEIMQATQKSYAEGKSDLTSLIVMEQSYRSIYLGYIYALTEYYSCWIDFVKEVNDESVGFETENI